MTDQQISIVLALARTGIANEAPSAAFIQQLSRLVRVLPEEEGRKVQAMITWHKNGRHTSLEEVQF